MLGTSSPQVGQWRLAREALARELLRKGEAPTWADAEALARERLRCGKPRKRDGCPCQAQRVPNRKFCRVHGGLSSGPKSAEAKQRLRERMTDMNRSEEARARSKLLMHALLEKRWGSLPDPEK